MEAAGPLGLPTVVDAAKNLHCDSMTDANVVFSTIHKVRNANAAHPFVCFAASDFFLC